MERYYLFDFPIDLLAVLTVFLLVLAAIVITARRGRRK